MLIVDKDLVRLIKDRDIIIVSNDSEYPFDPERQIGPGSIDLHLGPWVRRYKQEVSHIDLEVAGDTELVQLNPAGEFTIEPHDLWLATTLEVVVLPPSIGGIVTGRSSIARLGLLVQCSQDYIQPGHSQAIPLQLVNVTNRPITIRPYLLICQIALLHATSDADKPYGAKRDAKYIGELLTPQPSKMGTELGLDRSDELSAPPELDEKAKRLQDKVDKWQKEATRKKRGLRVLAARLENVTSTAYVVLGAAISVVLQELDKRPFPSTSLLIAGMFGIFSIAIIALARWRYR